MFVFLKALCAISAFIIIWAMIGYPMFLIVLDKLLKRPEHKKDYNYFPSVTVMAVAHNEEKVIWEKLDNLISIDYPQDKYYIIVTSDYSTDKTNELVEKFIIEHEDYNITLHKTVNHGGKTNAQNEAHRKVQSELLIMTDANCMFEKYAVRELVANFTDPNVMYVCGVTAFTNSSDNCTANSENRYWDFDSRCRDIESRIQTITAGDGNLYACRTCDYIDIPLIECHDSSFPVLFALKGGRALFDTKAIAYEKAGESDKDEYKRKVRMNRNIIHNVLPSVKILNIFKYKWFTIFWLGHRTCRYLLWISHFILLVGTMFLVFDHFLWSIAFWSQLLFYICAVFGIVTKSKNKLVKLTSYYVMTVFSQWHGIYNIVTGKSKPTWAKVESTR